MGVNACIRMCFHEGVETPEKAPRETSLSDQVELVNPLTFRQCYVSE